MKITFTIPGSPMGKGRPRFYRGHAVTPESTREYEKMTAMLARVAVGGDPFSVDAALRVDIDAYYAIPKNTAKHVRERMLSGHILPRVKPDADNIAKIVLDAINGVVYSDDKQVVDLRTRKMYAEQPRVVVAVEEIE